MQNPSEDRQGGPPAADRPTEHEGEQRLEHAPNLMPDIRGEAANRGGDPEEVDPLALDEDTLRRMSSDAGDLP